MTTIKALATNTPAVFVTTYAKFNNGQVNGDWVWVGGFYDADEFYEHCGKIHNDESEPEFMFIDTYAIPDCFYTENHINKDLWNWLELDQDERDTVAIYTQYNRSVYHSDLIKEALDACMGCYDSQDEFVESLIDIAVSKGELSEKWASVIDTHYYWDSFLEHEYYFIDNRIFRNA